MSDITVQRLSRETGEKVVPSLLDYDGVSSGWSEAEYRARLSRTQSLVGFWEGEPGWVAFDSWPYTEVCVILQGKVAIEGLDGQRAEFNAGEAFVVPVGFRGVWHTLEATQKIFVGIPADDPVLPLEAE